MSLFRISGPGLCGDGFPGKTPASEPETEGLIKYLHSILERTKVYISFHSFSQLLMYPWGYTGTPVANDQRLGEIAKRAAERLKSLYGIKYRTGPIATTIYRAAGTSLDYVHDAGVKYPFVFELRDVGVHGFALPKELIVPTAHETFEAVKVILEEAQKDG